MQRMGDVIFIAVTAAFFALAAGYVRGCARIVGPDSDEPEVIEGGQDDDETAFVSR